MSGPTQFSLLSQNVIKTLLYYDLFQYPLKADEVFQNLQADHVTQEEVSRELTRLVQSQFLFQAGEFFSLHHEMSLINRRIAGNEMARGYFRIARRRARWIYRFPFVRAVMISGSLSKNYADQETDIDFFVVTAPRRLWIARTLLVLFKRIFLFNSHKYFCVNYFVDEEHLEIEEKNLYTATELMTLVPLEGLDIYRKLIRENAWSTGFLPHAKEKSCLFPAGNRRHGRLKVLAEDILSSSLGRWLEERFMSLSKARWQKIYGRKVTRSDFEVSFKSTAHVSKNHPENYQRKVMDQYRRKLEELALRHTWKWSYE